MTPSSGRRAVVPISGAENADVCGTRVCMRGFEFVLQGFLIFPVSCHCCEVSAHQSPIAEFEQVSVRIRHPTLFATVLVAQMKPTLIACVLAASAGVAVAQYNFQELFVSNYTAYPTCYRQPILAILDAQRIIVFVEGRNNTWCSGTSDGSPSSIRLKYTQDGGSTWSAEAVLYTGGVDFLTTVYDSSQGRVHLFIQLGSKILYTTTDDGGATFKPVAPLTVTIPNGIQYAQPSVGHGLVVDGRLCGDGKCAGEAGRLAVPFICHGPTSTPITKGDVACPGCYSCLLISDDHGSTWGVKGITSQVGTREAALVQLVSAAWNSAHTAVLYANERNMGASPGYKQHAISQDAGSTFSLVGNDTELPDCVTSNWTGIVSGGTRVGTLTPTGPTGAQRVLLSIPKSPTERQDMAIFYSTDETQSWSSGTVIRPGPAGYSDLAAINETHVAIVFENGDNNGMFGA